MADLLAQASVIAEASAGGLTEKTSHGKAEDTEPVLSGTPLYDQMKARFDGCVTDADRQRQIGWAERALDRARRGARHELTEKQQAYWILEGSQGRDYQHVAQEFGLKPQTVWKTRLEYGFDPRTGRPKAA